MVQPIAINEFVTALTGQPSDQSQRLFVATSEGNIYGFTSQLAHELTQEVAAHLEDDLINGVAAYRTGAGVQHLVAATMGGNIYHFASQDQEPQLLANFDGAMFSAISAYASPASGAQYVVVATSEGAVYHLALQDEKVSQQQLGDFGSGVIGISGFVTPADATQHIFVAAGDGYIHHFTMQANQAPTQQVLAFFEESFISLTGYITPDGLFSIIPATRDGKLYHVIYDASKGQEAYIDIRDGVQFHDASKTPGVTVAILQRFYLLNDSGMMFIGGYATADATQHILVATSDGTITHISFQGTAYDKLSHEVVAQFQSMI